MTVICVILMATCGSPDVNLTLAYVCLFKSATFELLPPLDVTGSCLSARLSGGGDCLGPVLLGSTELVTLFLAASPSPVSSCLPVLCSGSSAGADPPPPSSDVCPALQTAGGPSGRFYAAVAAIALEDLPSRQKSPPFCTALQSFSFPSFLCLGYLSPPVSWGGVPLHLFSNVTSTHPEGSLHLTSSLLYHL